MVDVNTPPTEPGQPGTNDLEKKIGAASWALFFIWIGAVFLAAIPPMIALLGVAVIALGTQGVRAMSGLRVEPFWVIVGLLFVLWGIWDLLPLTLPLVPILLIVAGAALLASLFKGK
jgi:hypothetical protein